MADDGSTTSTESVRTGFSDVDGSGAAPRFLAYLDAARRAPAVVAAKAWSFEQMHLNEGNSVLDVGCGSGEDVVEMASRVGATGRAVGVDSSRAMIETARTRHGEGPLATFVVADARRLPFESETFDSCRSERTLQHVQGPEAAVDEMARVLKVGGWIALTEPDWETLVIEGSDPELSSAIMGHHMRTHAGHRMGRRLRGLLATRGFADISLGSGVALHTDLETSKWAFGITRAAVRAASEGLVPQQRARDWLSDLEKADEEGRFFCSVTGFRAAGRKS